MNTIGVIGLGRMGLPAAKRFIDAGFRVVGCDLRAAAMGELEEAGGVTVENGKQVAQKAKTVIVFVLNDQQVTETVSGSSGILEGCSSGATVICMSTIDCDNLQRLAEKCSEKGVGLVDCPCTGGPARVENGTLTMIMAAPKKMLDKCRPILAVLGEIIYAGQTPGLGQAIKHCNQLLVGTIHAAVMEIFALAKKSGLDARLVCKVVGNGIGGSDYFRLLATSVLENTPSPGGMGQLFKDISLVLKDSQRVQLPLLVTTAAFQYFLAAQSLGLGNQDSSKLIKVLEKMSGLEA